MKLLTRELSNTDAKVLVESYLSFFGFQERTLRVEDFMDAAKRFDDLFNYSLMGVDRDRVMKIISQFIGV